MWCGVELAVERKKVDSVDAASTARKKNKRKRDKTRSDKCDLVSSSSATNDEAAVSEREFVPHDYVKANLTTLIQGSSSVILSNVFVRKSLYCLLLNSSHLFTGPLA